MSESDEEVEGGLSPITSENNENVTKTKGTRVRQDRVDSFYEFPTVSKNANKTLVPKKCKTKVTCLVNDRKPPTWDEVSESCLEHDIYEKRTTEVKIHGVTYSQRYDAETSNGNLKIIQILALNIW